MSAPDENALNRPESACVLCPPPRKEGHWRRAEDGLRTCDTCLEKLGEILLDVVKRYRRLDPTPGANTDEGTRGAPGFESRSPASDHVILMRDRRSKSCEVARDGVIYLWDAGLEEFTGKREVWYGSDGRAYSEQTRPPVSIPFTLGSLADLVAEDREMTAPRGRMEDIAVWLDSQLDYVARTDWLAVEVNDVLRRLLSQLKPATGDRKHAITTCPNVVDEGEHTRTCGAKLYEPDRNGVIRCQRCDRSWPRDRWHGDGPEYLSQLAVDTRPQRRSA